MEDNRELEMQDQPEIPCEPSADETDIPAPEAVPEAMPVFEKEAEPIAEEPVVAAPAEEPPAEEPPAEEPPAVEAPVVAAPVAAAPVAAAPVATAPVAAAPAPAKKKGGKVGLIVGGVLAAALVAIVAVVLILFFTVIQPNAIYNDAVAALEKGDFVECQRLMDQIPNHKDISQLRQELTVAQAKAYVESGNLDQAEMLLLPVISNSEAKELYDEILYKRAAKAIDSGDFDDAKAYLEKIPNHEDPDGLRSALKYEEALALVENGDYETAYKLLSELGDYKDAKKQKTMVYYEALAFRTLFQIQSTLKDPASMRVKKITLYDNRENNDDLCMLAEITASNSFGGNIGGYVYHTAVFQNDTEPGLISNSTYVDPDTYLEKLQALIVDTIRKKTVYPSEVDIARMNRLLKADVTFKINLDFVLDNSVQN